MRDYSDHADRSGLERFVSCMNALLNEIRMVHGERRFYML
ncbi:MBL fold metallo-hydrolase RNA specificity domain-containing protein [Pseudomonas tohonis]|nr:MBL fold metallo-hydrolase RNA specificity domain-containing protein [Pseudomonas tohonis]